VGSIVPAMNASNVDLPLPLGPITVVRSPGAIARSNDEINACAPIAIVTPVSWSCPSAIAARSGGG
jgi:hypothetical protein